MGFSLPTFNSGHALTNGDTVKTQFEKLIKPPITVRKDGFHTIGSLKGRGVCVLRLVHNLIDSVFRFAQNGAFTIFAIVNIFRYTISLAFDYEASKAELKQFAQMLATNGTAFLLTIPAAIMDTGKYLIGATVHPGVAIQKK